MQQNQLPNEFESVTRLADLNIEIDKIKEESKLIEDEIDATRAIIRDMEDEAPEYKNIPKGRTQQEEELNKKRRERQRERMLEYKDMLDKEENKIHSLIEKLKQLSIKQKELEIEANKHKGVIATYELIRQTYEVLNSEASQGYKSSANRIEEVKGDIIEPNEITSNSDTSINDSIDSIDFEELIESSNTINSEESTEYSEPIERRTNDLIPYPIPIDKPSERSKKQKVKIIPPLAANIDPKKIAKNNFDKEALERYDEIYKIQVGLFNMIDNENERTVNNLLDGIYYDPPLQIIEDIFNSKKEFTNLAFELKDYVQYNIKRFSSNFFKWIKVRLRRLGENLNIFNRYFDSNFKKFIPDVLRDLEDNQELEELIISSEAIARKLEDEIVEENVIANDFYDEENNFDNYYTREVQKERLPNIRKMADKLMEFNIMLEDIDLIIEELEASEGYKKYVMKRYDKLVSLRDEMEKYIKIFVDDEGEEVIYFSPKKIESNQQPTADLWSYTEDNLAYSHWLTEGYDPEHDYDNYILDQYFELLHSEASQGYPTISEAVEDYELFTESNSEGNEINQYIFQDPVERRRRRNFVLPRNIQNQINESPNIIMDDGRTASLRTYNGRDMGMRVVDAVRGFVNMNFRYTESDRPTNLNDMLNDALSSIRDQGYATANIVLPVKNYISGETAGHITVAAEHATNLEKIIIRVEEIFDPTYGSEAYLGAQPGTFGVGLEGFGITVTSAMAFGKCDDLIWKCVGLEDGKCFDKVKLEIIKKFNLRLTLNEFEMCSKYKNLFTIIKIVRDHSLPVRIIYNTHAYKRSGKGTEYDENIILKIEKKKERGIKPTYIKEVIPLEKRSPYIKCPCIEFKGCLTKEQYEANQGCITNLNITMGCAFNVECECEFLKCACTRFIGEYKLQRRENDKNAISCPACIICNKKKNAKQSKKFGSNQNMYIEKELWPLDNNDVIPKIVYPLEHLGHITSIEPQMTLVYDVKNEHLDIIKDNKIELDDIYVSLQEEIYKRSADGKFRKLYSPTELVNETIDEEDVIEQLSSIDDNQRLVENYNDSSYTAPNKKERKKTNHYYVFFDYETVPEFWTSMFMISYSVSFFVVDEETLGKLVELVKRANKLTKLTNEFGKMGKVVDTSTLNELNKIKDEIANIRKPDDKNFKGCHNYIGYDCGAKFIEWFSNNRAGNTFTFVSYNGACYDNFLFFEELMRCIDSKEMFADGITVDPFYNGNMMLGLNINKRHTFFDLRRHLVGSLADNCKSWNVGILSKKECDHNYITELYIQSKMEYLEELKKKELHEKMFPNSIYKMKKVKDRLIEYCSTNQDFIDYNDYDVLSIAYIFHEYQESLRAIPFLKNIKLRDHQTIGGIIYSVFRDWCKKKGINNPKMDVDLYNELRKYKAAGRVELFNGAVEILGKPMSSLDVCSLYPYEMAISNHYFPCGEIEKAYHYESAPSAEANQKNRIGFYYCDVDQSNLRKNNLPNIYPEKTDIENIWDSTNVLSGYLLSNVMIDLLRKYGCKVTIRYKEDSEASHGYGTSVANQRYCGYLFTDKVQSSEMFGFLLDCMASKNQQDIWKSKDDEKYNPALRETLKLLMNSLSGKVIENLHTVVTELVSLERYTEIHHNRNYKVNCIRLFGSRAFATYEKPQQEVISKQHEIYLGVLIYDYSRRYMYENSYAMLGLKNLVYTDTDATKFKNEVISQQMENLVKHKKAYYEYILSLKNVKPSDSIKMSYGEFITSKKVPHWEEVEKYDERYKNHTLYNPKSKVFGSFEDELEEINKKISIDQQKDLYFYALQKKSWAYGIKSQNLNKFKFKGINGKTIVLNFDDKNEWESFTTINDRLEVIKTKSDPESNIALFRYSNNDNLRLEKNVFRFFNELYNGKSLYCMTMNFKKIVKNNNRNVGVTDTERHNMDTNHIQVNYVIKKISVVIN